jgi:hypothetical protein
MSRASPDQADNISGLFFRLLEVTAKQLELLRDALPAAAPVAVLWEAAAADQMRGALAAAATLGVEAPAGGGPSALRLRGGLHRADPERRGGRARCRRAVFFRERGRIADLALKHRLPP